MANPPISSETQIPALAKEFVEALNTKDLKQIRAFIDLHFDSSSISAEERTTRLHGLATEYGPFKLDKLIAQTSEELSLEATDGHGMRINVKLLLNSSGKITGVRLGPPGEQAAPKQYTDWSDLSSLAGQVVASEKLPGMAIAAYRDGRIESGFSGTRVIGKSDPVQKSDTWLVGSVGKSMTATLIARLIDQGKLRWDSTLGEVLPGYGFKPEYKDVTILQLLRHRAGVPQDELVRKPLVDSVLAAAGSHTPMDIRAAYVKNVLARDPIAKPGERMAYSNAGYAIAAHIAEKVGGKPFETLLPELVFKPLGMSSAGIGKGVPGSPNTAGEPHGHSKGKTGDFEPAEIGNETMRAMFAGAGGGIFMSAEDLCKFATYHLEGLRGEVSLMSKANFDKIHEPATNGPGMEKYGCGFSIVEEVTPEPFHGHNGSDGTFMAEMAIYPKSNLAIVAIANAAEEQMITPSLQAVVAYWQKYAKR